MAWSRSWSIAFTQEILLATRYPQKKTLHMDITRWPYLNQTDYIICSQDGEALYSQQKQDWELTVADYELLIAKFRLKLKKVGKTTRPFR